MSTDETATLIDSLISIIRIFADSEFQRRAWIDHDEKTFSFYEEAICQLFDDLGAESLVPQLESSTGTILNECRDFLSVVSKLDTQPFRKKGDFVDPSLLIQSEQWQKVVQQSNQAIIELELLRSKRDIGDTN